MSIRFVSGVTDITQYVVRHTSPSFISKQNERSTATLVLKPGYVPAKFEAVTMYDIDEVSKVFGGVVFTRSTQSYEQGSSLSPELTLNLVDYMVYTDWAFWYKVYTTSKTLKQVLTDLATDVLTPNYGIVIDSAQDNGDTFAPFTVGNDGLGQKVSDFLRALGTQCNPPRVIVMSADKELSMIIPGGTSTPFNVTAANPRILTFDWNDGDFVPANKVTLVCGPNATSTVTQSWTTNGILTSFEVDIQAVLNSSSGGTAFESAGGGVTRTVSPPGLGGYYYWDANTGKGTLSVGLGSAPAAGTLTLVYNAVYPFTVEATTGATPVVEAQFKDESQLLLGPAQLQVNGLLSQLNQSPRTATLVTLERGFETNQLITVGLSGHYLSGINFTIQEVSAEFTEFRDTATPGAAGREMWIYTCQLTETTIVQGTYLDQARQLFGGSSSGGGTPIISNSGTPIGDVFANRGADLASFPLGPMEAAMVGQVTNASVLGPALTLGRNDETFAWAIVANSTKGASPGTVASLEFVPIPDSSAKRRAMTLTQADTPVAGEYYLVGSIPGKLYIGAPSGAIGGFSGNAQMESVFANKFYEQSRSVAAGYWTNIAFSAGNFTASGAMTWTVGSGDQVTYKYTLVGMTMTICVYLNATTVGGTLDQFLLIALPSPFISAENMISAATAYDNGALVTSPFVYVPPSASQIRVYRGDLANWAASTDGTHVRFVMTLEVTF